MTKYIQPIGPIRPISPERLMELNPEEVITTIVKLACIFLFYLAVHKISKVVISKTPGYNKESKKIPIYHCISIVLVSSLLIAFGWSIELLKGIILLQILLYASVSDIQTHEVKDFISVLIFITGFIGVTLSDIPMMLFSGLAIGGVLLICAMVSGNRLGGADVKLSAACAFLLGFSKSIAGLVIGLFLAIICNIYFSHKNKTKGKAFPLVPYLSIGFMALYFI
ncbi:MAG: prepilin peptidase [Clostridia bacterium]|nr:prepilin peptidase [Clostridia bacterium]